MAVMKVFAGPPGTGKTWRAARAAVGVLRPGTPEDQVESVHRTLVDQGLIVWVTFHPSYSYEDFVEGFRPRETEQGGIAYDIKQGPFLRACATASMPVGPSRFHVGQRIGPYTVEEVETGGVVLTSNNKRSNAVTEIGRQFVDFWTIRMLREKGLDVSRLRLSGLKTDERNEVSKETMLPTTFLTNSSRHAAVYEYLMKDPQPTPVVLVIDEINRADLSRVFGELITLLEFDKREVRSVALTYSGQPLTVPAQLSIIGTMNTADKSLSTVDLALRRRFEFELVPPEPSLVPEAYAVVDLRRMFTDMNRRLAVMNGPENLIGHADWMGEKLEELRERQGYSSDDEGRLRTIAHTLRNKTLPSLIDLFRSDMTQVQFVLPRGLLETEELGDLARELGEAGFADAAGMTRPADWWDPTGASWDGNRLRGSLPGAR